jgi:hypothetical protein
MRLAAATPISPTNNEIPMNNVNDIDDDDIVTADAIVPSRHAQQLKRGTFLGFRNTKDIPGWKQSQQSTALASSTQALMPDGGLSPCVIRVLGVGGGGCNAVRNCVVCYGVCVVL